MNKTKLLKSILIPTLGISAIGSIAAVSTSCSCGSKEPDVIHVTDVRLSKSSTALIIGKTEKLTATVLPETATDKSVTWSSSNPSVATVDNNGTITAVSEGTATITVKTNDGGKTATCEVNVNDVIIHVTSVSLNKTSTTLDVGGTETLTATVLPQTATDKSVTWTSSNTNIAIVNSNGTITAKASGTATITVTTNDGGKTATCEVTVDHTPYVVITANEDSTLSLQNNGGNNPDLQYSTDRTNWTAYSTEISIDQGKNLYLKGNNPTGWAHRSNDTILYSTLSITGDVSISGNVMGLLDNGAKSGEQGDITGIPCEDCFSYLFYLSQQITSVSEDFLPATSLTDGCYFAMFQGCTSLTNAPALPATTLAEGCYNAMFLDCWSLTTAPELPSRILTNGCYRTMFAHCTSLTTAPELPSRILADSCYYSMFQGCTSLSTAPTLSTTYLKTNCYREMFDGCTSLNSIKLDYTRNYSDDYFYDWVKGVASSGTFYYNGSQTPQDFGFPSGWTKSPF